MLKKTLQDRGQRTLGQTTRRGFNTGGVQSRNNLILNTQKLELNDYAIEYKKPSVSQAMHS